MSNVKTEDDIDFDIYAGVNENELIDPDAVDERDEGAVADALGDDPMQGDPNEQKPSISTAPNPIPTFTTPSSQIKPNYQPNNNNNMNAYNPNSNGNNGAYQNRMGGGAGYGMPVGSGSGSGGGMGAGRDDFEKLKTVDPNEEGKVFCGGLSWSTNDDTLRAYLSQYGPLEACMVMKNPEGRSRGFAFAVFANPRDIDEMLKKEHVLDGKTIDIKRATPKEQHSKSHKVFIGGLSPSLTNAALRKFFEDFTQAKVLDAHIMVDRETNRNKGFGFVQFETGEALEKALGATGQELEGKPIEVKLAQPKHAREREQDQTRRHIGSYMSNDGAQSGKYQHGPPMGEMNMPGMGMPGFNDPQAMAMMWQRMMMSMMNPMMNMNMMNQQSQPMTGMRSPMAQGMQGMPNMMPGMNMGAGAYNPMMMMNMNMNRMPGAPGTPSTMPGAAAPTGSPPQGQAPAAQNAPRGPAAMRGPPPSAPAAPSGGGQPARYSTQGQARSRPY